MVKSNNPNTAQRNPVAAFTMNSLDLRGDDPEGDFDVGESRGDDDDDNMTAVGVIADFFHDKLLYVFLLINSNHLDRHVMLFSMSALSSSGKMHSFKQLHRRRIFYSNERET